MKTILTVVARFFGRTVQEEAAQEADEVELFHASREFFEAVSARHAAEATFNQLSADTPLTLIDAAINDMNIATMRVDNASRRLRELSGLPSPEQLKEIREGMLV